MRASPRSKMLALLIVATAPSCTLLNSLDYLQSGRDEDPTSPAADGSVATPGSEPDPVVLPGCGPGDWPTCGVTSVARGGKPGGAVFVHLGPTVSLYFTDEGSGTVSNAICSTSACDAPSVLVSGEDEPRKIAHMSGMLAWTTRSAVRRLKIAPKDDAGVATIAAITGTSDIVGEYPYFAWTDDKGAHAYHQADTASKTLSTSLAQSPAILKCFYFVADDAVQENRWDGYDRPPATAPLPGTRGAELVTPATFYAQWGKGSAGLVATVRRDGGTALVVADSLDDAGAPRLLTLEEEPIRAVVTTATYVYWTTASGLLRRQLKDSVQVATVLHGLSGETSLAVSPEGLLAVVDRRRGEILTYAPP